MHTACDLNSNVKGEGLLKVAVTLEKWQYLGNGAWQECCKNRSLTEGGFYSYTSYLMTANFTTLSVLESHSPNSSFSKCDISYLWRVVRSLCICRASCISFRNEKFRKTETRKRKIVRGTNVSVKKGVFLMYENVSNVWNDYKWPVECLLSGSSGRYLTRNPWT